MPHPCRGGEGGVPPPRRHRRPLPHGRFFSFRQLNALAIVIILSASDMVAATDLTFILFSLLYLHLLPPSSSSPVPDLSVFGFHNLVVTAVLGLLVPIAYILDGVLAGDKEGIKAATPHVFLLAIVIVLSASGMAAAVDLAFILFSLVYLHLLSSTAFPPSSSSPVPDPPVFGFRNPVLIAVLGLLVPIAYILDDVLAGDNEGIKATAPHVFLLATQVFLLSTAPHVFLLPFWE